MRSHRTFGRKQDFILLVFFLGGVGLPFMTSIRANCPDSRCESPGHLRSSHVGDKPMFSQRRRNDDKNNF